MAQKENKRCRIVFYDDLRKCQKSFKEKMLKIEKNIVHKYAKTREQTVLLKNIKNKFFPIVREISF